MLYVFGPGSEVSSAGVVMTVLEVLIGSEGIKYKCGWWNEHDHKTDWFASIEITGEPSKQSQIGFHTLREN